ncbi:hypothetical protein HK102_008461 [Quaeritorhiza haematococci]|nr:hypothetical protein HK102_008461 [Quaeritorhiza haematococci]
MTTVAPANRSPTGPPRDGKQPQEGSVSFAAPLAAEEGKPRQPQGGNRKRNRNTSKSGVNLNDGANANDSKNTLNQSKSNSCNSISKGKTDNGGKPTTPKKQNHNNNAEAGQKSASKRTNGKNQTPTSNKVDASIEFNESTVNNGGSPNPSIKSPRNNRRGPKGSTQAQQINHKSNHAPVDSGEAVPSNGHGKSKKDGQHHHGSGSGPSSFVHGDNRPQASGLQRRRLSAPDIHFARPNPHAVGSAAHNVDIPHHSTAAPSTSPPNGLYAGAMFQNSPAASSLPIPVFSSSSSARSSTTTITGAGGSSTVDVSFSSNRSSFTAQAGMPPLSRSYGAEQSPLAMRLAVAGGADGMFNHTFANTHPAYFSQGAPHPGGHSTGPQMQMPMTAPATPLSYRHQHHHSANGTGSTPLSFASSSAVASGRSGSDQDMFFFEDDSRAEEEELRKKSANLLALLSNGAAGTGNGGPAASRPGLPLAMDKLQINASTNYSQQHQPTNMSMGIPTTPTGNNIFHLPMPVPASQQHQQQQPLPPAPAFQHATAAPPRGATGGTQDSLVLAQISQDLRNMLKIQ